LSVFVAFSVALSTAFAHARAISPSEILDSLARADAGGVILDAALDPPRYEVLARELRRSGEELPVLAVEAPCPADRTSIAQLASTDKEEAKVALDAAEATIRRAGELSARFVVVRLGAVRAADREWTVGRSKFLRGDLDEQLARRLVEARDAVAERALDVARRALDRLARAAETAGLTLTVAQSRRFTDLPSPREIDLLLRDLSGAPVAPLFDSASAHLQDQMGAWPMAVSVAAFGVGPLLYLGDACGPIGGLEPGRGILDPAFLTTLPKHAAVAFRPWPGLTTDEVVHALPAVERWSSLRAKES
jgi:hypothetical protein